MTSNVSSCWGASSAVQPATDSLTHLGGRVRAGPARRGRSTSSVVNAKETRMASNALFQMEDYAAAADLSDFDYLGLDAATLANPYPFFRALREQAPVFQEPHQGV